MVCRCLLGADVPDDQEVTADQMDTARQIIDRRVNALGVTEPLVQTEGDRRILVELPGIDNPQEAISLIQETALLEFVDTGRHAAAGRHVHPHQPRILVRRAANLRRAKR